ncbi:MAG: FGGY family carbohydrate kinase, partial [Terriglobales bacterium]
MPSRNRGKPYLAFDLGAESGRAVLAHCRSGVLTIEEVHRFANTPITRGRSLYWDVDKLWLEMRNALAGLDKIELESIGVDAWGVDYALLGEHGELLQKPYHYRDRRTEGVMDEVFRKVPRQEIYQETGVQFMPINTMYQLFAARRDSPEIFSSVRQLITIPDLFHYWLSGSAVCEFT